MAATAAAASTEIQFENYSTSIHSTSIHSLKQIIYSLV